MYFTIYQTLSICTADYQTHPTGHFPVIYRIPKDTFSLTIKYWGMLGGTVLLHHQWVFIMSPDEVWQSAIHLQYG
jgi:hypothetical protein